METKHRLLWEAFKDSKLLWWINRSLHLFGWAIVLECEEDGTVISAYPMQVSYRGFPEEIEERNFKLLGRYLEHEIGQANDKAFGEESI